MTESTHKLTDAGKITVLTTFLGVFIFAVVFLLNLGGNEPNKVDAQGIATTSVTVINTPPSWTVDAREEFESSTTTPTDAGLNVQWVATGTDSNAERYYLLICKNFATPTPGSFSAPSCDSPSNQWGVSASTTSGTMARVSTTTADAWAEKNDWYAWVCDGNVSNPRCNTTYKNGTSTPTFESPFVVNHRPTFTLYTDDSTTTPGSLVTFYSTSTDPDSLGGDDTVKLTICSTNNFSTTTNTCAATTISSSTVFVTDDASATYTVVIPTQDQNYTAYGFIIDDNGFEALGGAQGTDSTLTVGNVAPTVTAGSISVNGGSNIILSQSATQTPGFTLSFTAVDNNSCQTSASTSELVSNVISVYRSGITDAVCDGSSGAYNPNSCYTSGSATSTWDLSCTLDTNSCSGALDTAAVYNCTFPLWYFADPTDGTATSTQYSTQHWMSAIQAIDDDFATGTKATSTTGVGHVDVESFLSYALNTATIPYGSLEPGQQTDPIVATTTLAATGNLGLDQRLQGESMCPTYTTSAHCNNSSSSTVDASEQVYGTTTSAYAAGFALSSTTIQELELNVQKSTTTTGSATGNTYWGIRIPGTITLAGDYTGENTFYGINGESSDW